MVKKKVYNKRKENQTLRDYAILASDLMIKCIDQSLLHGSGTAEYSFDAVQVCRSNFRMRYEEQQERRHDEQNSRFVLFQASQVILGRELGHGDQVIADVGQVVEDGVEAVYVEEGQDGQDGFLRHLRRHGIVYHVRVNQLNDVGHEVTVGQHHSLGHARGARTVGQYRQIRRLDLGKVDRPRRFQ